MESHLLQLRFISASRHSGALTSRCTVLLISLTFSLAPSIGSYNTHKKHKSRIPAAACFGVYPPSEKSCVPRCSTKLRRPGRSRCFVQHNNASRTACGVGADGEVKSWPRSSCPRGKRLQQQVQWDFRHAVRPRSCRVEVGSILARIKGNFPEKNKQASIQGSTCSPGTVPLRREPLSIRVPAKVPPGHVVSAKRLS